MGLSYEAITSVVVDPRNGNNLYVGSDVSSTLGRILRSTNAGLDWSLLVDSVIVEDMVMDPDSSNILMAALYPAPFGAPAMIKTTDAGETWFRSDSGISTGWGSGLDRLVIDPRHPQILFAGAGGFDGGGLFKTTDGGGVWEFVADSNGPQGRKVRGIGIDPDSTNWIYASDFSTGRFYISSDGGTNWRSVLTDVQYGAGGYSLTFGVSPGTLYLADAWHFSAPKGLLKSTDRGASWSYIAEGIPGNYANILSIIRRPGPDPDELYAGVSWRNDFSPDSASGNGVFVSHDSGHTWQNTGLDSATVVSLAFSPDKKYLYAGVNSNLQGKPRGVYRLDLSTTSAHELVTLANSFRLFQNYPNPFNTSTTLPYELPSSGEVSIKIFDVLGRKVRSLIDNMEIAGIHQILWDATNQGGELVGTGLYFVRATYVPSSPYNSATRIETRAIILMK